MADSIKPKISPLDLFKELVQLPTFTSATFLDPVNSDGQPDPDGDHRCLHVGLSAKLHHRGAKISLTKDVPLLDARRGGVTAQLPHQEVPNGQVEFFAPNGRLKGILVTRDDERYVEVWDLPTRTLKAAKKVTKEVGEFLADEQWGQPTFSPSSDLLLFAAHPPPDAPTDAPKSALDKYRFTPTWGELQRSLTLSQLYIFNFTSSPSPTVRPLQTLSGVSFGQGQFGRGDGGAEGVVCTGFEPMEDERKLGVVYCANRRSAIWWFPLDKPHGGWRLTPESRSARSARVLPWADMPGGANEVVFLSNPLGGPHNSCTTLHYASLDSSLRSVADILFDTVWEPTDEQWDFPGLYLNALPAQPFLASPGGNRRHMVLSSIFQSRTTMFVVPLPGPGESVKPCRPEHFDSSDHSQTVLGTNGKDLIVTVSSNLVEAPSLTVHRFKNGVIVDPFCWHLDSSLSEEVDELLLPFWPRISRLPNASHVETLSLYRDEYPADAERKLLLIPHGGPHSTMINAFSPSIAALAVAGFEVANVNYTGSLGFGQRWVEELVGKCGERDVADCWAVVEAWKARLKPGQTGKVYIQGGSHGGFLTAHLTSRYPEAFEAAILRNPVVSLGENLCVTDIPDWVFNELGLPYPLESAAQRPNVTPTAEQYAFLQSRSPITHVDAVRAHTLVLMGLGDRRVPPPQSKAWYHSLKGKSAHAARTGGRRLDVECLAFEGEGHAIDGVAAELAAFEATLEWLGRY